MIGGPIGHGRRRALRVQLAIVLAGAVLAIAMDVRQPLAQSAGEARQRLEKVQEALREKQAREKGLVADVGQLQAERERLNGDLIETAARIQKGEAGLTAIEGRLGELEAQERLLRGSLSERHGSIARLLGAMQRMGRDPPPVMITRREDALVMVRSAMMLASAFPQLKSQALDLAGQLADLTRIMDENRSEGERLKAETQRMTEARIQMASLIEQKRQSLAERQGELDRVRREAAEIARSVTDLNELIERIDRVVARETAGPHAAPAPPAAVAAAPEPPASVARPPAASEQPLSPPAPPDAVVLAPKGTRLTALNPGRIKPAMPFAEARGRLPMPVAGKRIIGFGAKAHTSRSSGIVIETRPGAQVVSPLDGWIVFAGVFRSYGQILIINGGDGYHMLLAGLSQIDVQLGQFVLAGEPVGLMSGASPGAKAKPPANAPVLYIELRKDGHSIDPDPWWASEGTQKVQG
ncbi:MAG: murein hydrolase activator EnvC [Hyphomicrobiaceae bacterium]